MIRGNIVILVLIFLMGGASFSAAQSLKDDVSARPAYPDLSFNRPVDFSRFGADGNHVVVVEQPGSVYRFPNKETVTPGEKHLLIDLKQRVSGGERGEGGLLGIAFHPRFSKNRNVFLNYTSKIRGQLHSIISSFRYRPGRDRIDADSEKQLLTINQPGGLHNGGCLMFGPNGYLFSSIGQGGTKEGNAQDTSNLLGTIIRIDVDRTGPDRAYGIPEGNPFTKNPDIRDEIVAFGFRNPWRFSIDSGSGTIWLGDSDNEINIVRKGENHGYPVKRLGKQRDTAITPPTNPLHEPILRRDNASRSEIPHIPIGGYIYRGQKIPTLQGMYVYGDFTQNDIWGLAYDWEAEEVTAVEKLDTVPHPTAFGLDHQGELYICSFGPERGNMKNGSIYKLIPAN